MFFSFHWFRRKNYFLVFCSNLPQKNSQNICIFNIRIGVPTKVLKPKSVFIWKKNHLTIASFKGIWYHAIASSINCIWISAIVKVYLIKCRWKSVVDKVLWKQFSWKIAFLPLPSTIIVLVLSSKVPSHIGWMY